MPDNNYIKILPTVPPIITTFPKYANLLSIIGNYEETLPWIFNNYINLFCCPLKAGSNLIFLDFLDGGLFDDICPYINLQTLEKDLLKTYKPSFIDFLINSIDLKYYVYLKLDTFDLPHYTTFGKKHFCHPVFIIGYDKKDSEFIICDNFSGKQGVYGQEKASFSQMQLAFDNSLIFDNPREITKVRLLNFVKPPYKYNFNINKVVHAISDYLFSIDRSNKFHYTDYNPRHNNLIYGIQCYEEIINYLKNGCTDIRIFHLLHQHKYVMLLRIEFMVKNGYLLKNAGEIYQQYKTIESQAKIVLKLFIKYLIAHKPEISDRIIEILTSLSLNEKLVLNRILEVLIT